MSAEVGLPLLAASLALAACAKPDCAQTPPPPPAELGEPAAPEGYQATRVLAGLVEPTQLQFDSAGKLFVLEGGPGLPKAVRVFAPDLREVSRIPLEGEGEALGLLVFGAGERVLVGSRGRIDGFRAEAGGGFVGPEPWVTDLPNGEHTNDGMALGPDGFVYFAVGSTCDVCDEVDPRSATVMRAAADQSAPVPEVYARGLRNAYDLAFTDGGVLLATDNGPECCGDEAAGCTGPGVDRLLEIRRDEDYGWPRAYRERATAAPALALAELPLHGGATGLVADDGAMCGGPSIFLTLWGTQHGRTEAGRSVYRVRLGRDELGVLVAAPPESFMGPSGLGHPIDVAIGPDGALYVLDFEGSVVRVALNAAGACP